MQQHILSLLQSLTLTLICPQIETENGNKTVANLERILDDYKAIRQENAALAAKVREGWSHPQFALLCLLRPTL